MPGDSRLVTASFLNTNFSAYYIGGGSPSTDNTIIMDCSQIIANYNVYANGTGNRCPAQNEITAGITTTTTTIAYYSFASTTYYYATTALGCASWATNTTYYANTSNLSSYPILYYSNSLSNPVVGTNDYYPILYLSQQYLIRIDNDGSTSDLYNCVATTTTTTTILCGAYSYYVIYRFNSSLDTRASQSAASTALCTYASNPVSSNGYTIYTNHSYPVFGDYISVSQYGPPCNDLPTGSGWYVTRHISGGYFKFNVVNINGFILSTPTKLCELECPTMYYVNSTPYDGEYDACNSSTFNSCDVNELYSANEDFSGGWTPAQWFSGDRLFYDHTFYSPFVGDSSKWYKIKNQGTYYTARIASSGRVYDLKICSTTTTTTTAATTTTTTTAATTTTTTTYDCYNDTLTITNMTKVNSTDFRIYFTPNLMEEYSEWDWKTGTTWYVGNDSWLYAASGDQLSMPYSFTGSVSYRIRRDCTDSFNWGPWSNTYVFDWGTTTTTTTTSPPEDPDT